MAMGKAGTLIPAFFTSVMDKCVARFVWTGPRKDWLQQAMRGRIRPQRSLELR